MPAVPDPVLAKKLAATRQREAKAIARDELRVAEAERKAAKADAPAPPPVRSPAGLRAALEGERDRLNAQRDEHQHAIGELNSKLGKVNAALKELARAEAEAVLRYLAPLVAGRCGIEVWRELLEEAKTMAAAGAPVPPLPGRKTPP
jgi:hypothetical protein